MIIETLHNEKRTIHEEETSRRGPYMRRAAAIQFIIPFHFLPFANAAVVALSCGMVPHSELYLRTAAVDVWAVAVPFVN
ncbi:hypothetical protein QTP88_004771 [Uroleucon formosanum]